MTNATKVRLSALWQAPILFIFSIIIGPFFLLAMYLDEFTGDLETAKEMDRLDRVEGPFCHKCYSRVSKDWHREKCLTKGECK